MKLIYPDGSINSIIASSTNPNFPLSYLQDIHVNNVWKSTEQVATLTLNIAAGANAIALFNTNAESVRVSVSGWDELDWQRDATRAIDWQRDATRAIDWSKVPAGVAPTIFLYDLSPSDVGNLWTEYDSAGFSVTVEMEFTAPFGEVVQAGVLRAGPSKEYRDARAGISESFRDYSVKEEINAGGLFIRKRNSARTMSFEFVEKRDTKVYDFLFAVYRLIGPLPVPWRILNQGSKEWEWVIYASFDIPPEAEHAYNKDSIVYTELLESI